MPPTQCVLGDRWSLALALVVDVQFPPLMPLLMLLLMLRLLRLSQVVSFDKVTPSTTLVGCGNRWWPRIDWPPAWRGSVGVKVLVSRTM